LSMLFYNIAAWKTREKDCKFITITGARPSCRCEENSAKITMEFKSIFFGLEMLKKDVQWASRGNSVDN